jgi:vacuolar-type H+-ATPase subunit H
MAEKTLLQQIREKELMLNIRIEDIRKEADEIIANAERDAAEMIEHAEITEEAASREYYEYEMEGVKREIEHLRSQGDQEAVTVKERGERGLPQAIERIVRSVSME